LLSDQYHNLKIEVAIFHIKNNGLKYVQYINEAIQFYPQIKPIFFFMRALLQKFKLHDRNKRGLKTYSLFLMIYSLMHIFSNSTLGELLLNITRYYGFAFEYSYESNEHN
jgi:DNA polymerase sigma